MSADRVDSVKVMLQLKLSLAEITLIVRCERLQHWVKWVRLPSEKSIDGSRRRQ